MTQVGLHSLTILNMSGQRCLLSFSPSWLPATENGWQGYPPVTMSMGASVSSLICSYVNSFISLYCFTLGQCFFKTLRENFSISQNATVSNPPVASSPKLNPPSPLNKSKCLSIMLGTLHMTLHLCYPL